MVLKSIRLEIDDIETLVYVCGGEICPCSEDMAPLNLKGIGRNLQGTPFQLFQGTSDVTQTLDYYYFNLFFILVQAFVCEFAYSLRTY